MARLALAIFDQTRSVHGLGDRERDWLEYGALLHDIGVHISYERHHRHSYYLIKNGDLRGFDPQEIEMIALIARYHRQGDAQEVARRLRRSQGRRSGATVKALSAMVRLAEGLDRSHSQALAGIDLYPRGDDYLARLRTDRRRGAGAVGGASPRRAARARARQADALRSRCRRPQGTVRAC